MPHPRRRRNTRRTPIETLERRVLLAAEPVISEFMASNSDTLADKDGEYSDWIEIYNRGDEPASLLGWRLADSGNSWVFPDVTIEPGGYLVIFASDKNVTTGPELHTNFKLSADGEYLGLLRPDGSPASEYAPAFPIQSSDVSYGLSPVDWTTQQYFTVPTPGAPNQLISSSVAFSEGSRTFFGTLTLSLGLPPDASPTAQIRYTTDRSMPTASSPLYTGPLNLTRTTVVRAAVFEAGMAPGPVTTQTYVAVDASVRDFDSNLPVIVLDTFGAGLNSTTLTQVAAYVIDTSSGADGGRARMLDLPDFAGRGGLRYRGQSSEGFPKKQFAFETWDEVGDDLAVSILGMPAESDWVIYAPYSEKSLMQNYLAYQWAERLGQYSVRTRFVEVFLNTDGGTTVNYASDYVGVYIFMEKIKVDSERVDIAKLTPQDNALPDVSGGYIFKNDKADPGETGFTTSRGYTFLFADPGEDELTSAQKAYLKSYMDEFESVLYGPNFKDPVNGYAKYIDVDSWIDHHILTELAKNIDGFRISTYYTKDRNGKVQMGPLWDFNLSMGNANYNTGESPTGWYNSILSDAEYRYFRRLFEDPDFAQRYVDRWTELRRDALSTERLMADIDALVELLTDGNGNYPVGTVPPQAPNNPVVRNFQRWQILGTYVWPNAYYSASWIDEVNRVKNFLTHRAAWIDSQYQPAPVITRGSSLPEQPVPVTMTSTGGRPIYFTLDGSDPRLPGGGLSPSAQLYTGALAVTVSTRVRARVLVGTAWSGLTEVIIGIDQGLRVTELNYHPDGGDGAYNDEDYEFIELLNTGSQPIDLTGYRFDDGVELTIGPRVVAGPPTYQDWQWSGEGTGYWLSQLSSAPPAGPSPSWDALRLLSDAATDGVNRVAFDQTSTLAEPTRITAEFDLTAFSAASTGALAGTPTFRNFDGTGQTPYTTRRYGSAPSANVRSGGPSGSYLRLITDGNGDQSNRIRFDRTLSGSYTSIVADFDFRLSSNDAPADGFSLLFLPTATYGTTGAGVSTASMTAEEPNLPGVFAVGFDVYQGNDVSLHWNGSQVHSVTLPTSTFNLAQGVFHHARVELLHVAGGAVVTVTLTRDAFSANPQPVVVLAEAFIAGLNPYDSRVEFAARSGGLNMSVDLDNIDIRYLAASPGPAGISALLLPTDTFGASGPGTGLAHFSGKPNVAGGGVFAIDLSFDAATGAQELSLHYGTTLMTIPFGRAVADLVSGQTYTVKLELTAASALGGGGGGEGVYVTVSLTPHAGSTKPIVLASNVLVPGLELRESRLELAARSTTNATRIDVDNVRAEWAITEAPVLAPGERAVFVKNAAAFAERYGDAIEPMGVYTGSLSNSGERLRILDPAGALVAEFRYSDSGAWPGRADGKGSTLEVIDPHGDLSSPSNWRSSSEYRGSPGYAGAGPLRSIVINEVLSRTEGPLLDAIELYNASDAPVDLSGWYLSDSSDNYVKYRIPDGTVLGPGEYVVFDESHFNPTPGSPAPHTFALDGTHGDDVWLLVADPATGRLLAFADSVHFGAAVSGESFGRWPSGSPTGQLEPMTSLTLGWANSGPRVGPVVIHEVMYHPANDDHNLEFVEILNPTVAAVDVSGWRLAGAVDLVFPAGTVLPAGGLLVAVPFDPALPADAGKLSTFRNAYLPPADVLIVGPYTGRLDNAGERLRLERPEPPPPEEPTYTPYVLVDQVAYGTTAPWPESADGAGDSLRRLDVTAWSSDPATWAAGAPTPGALTVEPDAVFVGTSGADGFTFRLDPTGAFLQLFLSSSPTGSPIFTRALADVASITVLGLDGNDVLTVDFTYGDPIPAGGIRFDGGAGNDTFNVMGTTPPGGGSNTPPRSLRFDAGTGGDAMTVRGGRYDVALSNAGTLNLTADLGADAHLAAGPLVLNWLTINTGARVSLAAGGASPLVVNDLPTDGTGTLDLADNTMAVWGYFGAQTVLSTLAGRVATARNAAAGPWTGVGITSSVAATTPFTGLATVVNDDGAGGRLVETLAGVSIPADRVIVKFTRDGDTDIDGDVDIDDRLRMDAGFMSRVDAVFGNEKGGYRYGDVNYDGRIDAADYYRVDGAAATQPAPGGLSASGAPSSVATPSAAPQSAMPASGGSPAAADAPAPLPAIAAPIFAVTPAIVPDGDAAGEAEAFDFDVAEADVLEA